MGIFAVVAVFVSQSLTNGYLALLSQKQGAPQSAEVDLLRRHILSLEVRETLEKGGNRESISGDGRYDWSAEIEPTEVIDLFKVIIEIRLPDSGTDPLREEHYVYRPKGWSKAEERGPLLEEKRRNYESSYR